MAIKIYVDILFLTNMIFDYILLCFTAVFTKTFAKPLRLLLAAGAGAVLAVISFFAVKNLAVTMITQLIVSTIMVIVAFGARDLFGYLRISAVLYVCTFTLGGVCLSLVKTDGFVLSGGAFYIDISLAELLFAGMVTYILSNISYGFVLNKRARKELSHKITIEHNKKSVELLGYYDTGNVAKDEFGRGILIANKESLVSLLEGENTDFKTVIVDTVGGKAELKSFVPDKIYYEGAKKIQPKRKVAFLDALHASEKKLILPEDFFDYK